MTYGNKSRVWALLRNGAPPPPGLCATAIHAAADASSAVIHTRFRANLAFMSDFLLLKSNCCRLPLGLLSLKNPPIAAHHPDGLSSTVSFVQELPYGCRPVSRMSP